MAAARLDDRHKPCLHFNAFANIFTVKRVEETIIKFKNVSRIKKINSKE